MKRLSVVCLLIAVTGLIVAGPAAAAPSCSEPSAVVVSGGSVSVRLACKIAPGASATYAVASRPQHGTVTEPDATGTVLYTANAGYVGTDQFELSATDDSGTTVRAAWVNVIPADPPTCETRTEQVLWNQPSDLTLLCQGLPLAGALTHEITRAPEHGTLTWGDGGEGSSQVRYEPAPGFSGTDSFAYRATNRSGTSEEAVATIEVLTRLNEAPACYHDGATRLRPGRTVSLAVHCSDADGDPVTLERAAGGGPVHGTVGIEPETWGGFTVTYTADARFEGSEVVDLVASDGIATAAIAPIVVEVVSSGVNTAPVCWGTQFTSMYNGNAFGSNCVDAENDPLTFAVSDPEHGTATLQDSTASTWGVFYKPDRGYVGPDAFTLTANDGRATSEPVTIAIDVQPPHFGPPECAPAAVVRKNQSAGVNLGCTHLGESMDIEILRRPAHGTLVVPADGGVPVYMPRRGFEGTDSFTFVAVNEAGESQTYTRTLTVTNKAPKA